MKKNIQNYGVKPCCSGAVVGMFDGALVNANKKNCDRTVVAE
ncbi:MAG TPA: hypothetical protein PKM20_10190 [Nitrosomonas sp.]|nr:hypothetical protein [Nitrosomonas sp.]